MRFSELMSECDSSELMSESLNEINNLHGNSIAIELQFALLRIPTRLIRFFLSYLSHTIYVHNANYTCRCQL